MLTCQICGYTHKTMISTSHLKTHGVTAQEYKLKFPDQKLRVQTEESKAKIANSKGGAVAWNKGIKTGKNEKLSLAKKGVCNLKLKGKKRSSEQCQNISAGTQKAMAMPEIKTKISIGVSNSYAQKKADGIRIVSPMTGKSHSNETKTLISSSLQHTFNVNREKQVQSNIDIAQQQNVRVLNVEDQYWYNMQCMTCQAQFTFTKQIFLPSTRNGKELCPTCFPRLTGRSQIEIDFANHIAQLESNVIVNDRSVLSGKEIDVFIPSKNIGFEFTGLYWHAEKQNPERKHLLWKKQYAAKKGITLYTVFEDEWLNSKELVLSRIKSILGIIQPRIHSRKCEVKVLSARDKNAFLHNNHLQAADSCSLGLGLFHNDELVSVATFKKTNMVKGGNGKEWELSRFCSKQNLVIPGAASKLITHFMKVHNDDKCDLISYADSRWSSGKLYQSIGFEFDGITTPSYWYLKDYSVRVHRSSFMKHKLVKNEEDKKLTEWELAQRAGLDRIWDCGTTKWRLKVK